MSIRVLPDVVAAQIAAGEVVERPASVVKELIENALDADASAITVEADGGGRRLVRVSDNGTGIPAAEAALAFARHATSKLQKVEDLDHIVTLGFRGEALASISAVSRTTLVSRHRDETTGVEVQVEGGEVRHERAAGAPTGTVITVENLFFNTPARLKFLKSESTERRHIMQLVTHYAMAYPDVRFRLVQEGREQFHSTGSGDLADVLVEVFGLDTFKEMLEVHPQPAPRPDVPLVEVYGFTSVPTLTRTSRSHIVLFVNGRAISDHSLAYAVTQAYQPLPRGHYPLAVLLVRLSPEDVDVNVHPTKAEVRFRVPDAVFAAVQRAVRRTIAGQAPAGTNTGGYGEATSPVGSGWGDPRDRDAGISGPPRQMVPGERQMRLELGTPGGVEAAPEPDVAAIPGGAGRPLRPRTLPILRVVGQVGATYIVAEGPVGVYLIDQHAAHERVLYDQLNERIVAGDAVERCSLRTMMVDLPPGLARLVEEAFDLLGAFGFDLELFGSNTFRVRAIPMALADQEPAEVLSQIAYTLDDSGDGDVLADRLIRLVAQMGAYKAGQVLTYDEMQGLIQRLERCDTPLADPDGAPTMLHISGEDLARQFGRG